MKYVMILIGLALVLFWSDTAQAQDQCRDDVWASAQVLQPWYKARGDVTAFARRHKHLTNLTAGICEASAETGVNALIALSIARRESSLLPFVGLGKKNGAAGERGYFQVMPDGYAEKHFAPDQCSQHSPRCNAITAFRYMRFNSERCPGGDDPWIWVGAYGMGHCPDPDEARADFKIREARRYYCTIVPDCAQTWPE